MTKKIEDLSNAAQATNRFNDLLKTLIEQGLTQAQIAGKVGLPPQYFSDIKRGQRPVTELVARRLGEEFQVNYRWILGTSNTLEIPAPPENAANGIWLPVFPFPIEGEPRQHPKWNGTGVEIAGVAAGRIGLARLPYVLQFGHQDVKARLHQGDLILISQQPNDAAEIQIVSYRKKFYLARRQEDGSWRRVANDDKLSGDCPVIGHCLGIIWSPLI